MREDLPGEFKISARIYTFTENRIIILTFKLRID